jgi:hypothetical protein
MMASWRLLAAVMPALNGTLQKAHLIKPQPHKLGLGISEPFYLNFVTKQSRTQF